MKRVALIIGLVGFAFAGTAQEKKPDCQPSNDLTEKKSCAPSDTKTGEARVITSLREDIQSLKEAHSLEGQVKQGITDDESLAILVDEAKALVARLNIEFPQIEGSNAQQVAGLRQLVAELKSN